MPTETIFIGSSSEGQRYAQVIASAIRKEHPSLRLRCWWHKEVFKQGEVFIETLEREVKSASSGIFVFSPDDLTEVREELRWMPRDNILLEYGMFVGLKGRPRVAIVQVGEAKLPSDLSGVTVARVGSRMDDDVLADEVMAQLRGWLDRLPTAANQDPHPGVTEVLAKLRPDLVSWPPRNVRHFDRTASQLLRSTYESTRTDNLGVNDVFARAAQLEAENSLSISAYDTTGPAGWIGPATYRYLAHQVREYLFANRTDGAWKPFVHEWLHKALVASLKRAAAKLKEQESLSRFDDSSYELPEVGVPKLQYSRVLLWTEEELDDPLAEPIINIHDAFRIPLFYAPVTNKSPEKELAFVVFEKRNGDCSALYGLRDNGYDTARDRTSLEGGLLGHRGYALDLYRKVLERDDLMLATDALWILRRSRQREERRSAGEKQTTGV